MPHSIAPMANVGECHLLFCTFVRANEDQAAKPVATTVMERTLPIVSSTCAPKMMLASGSACAPAHRDNRAEVRKLTTGRQSP
eukprot:scaffold177046_cov30-Tisochrysis_lutea.AAC.5